MAKSKDRRKASIRHANENDIDRETELYLKTMDSSLKNKLGKCYKPKNRHRLLPPLPKLKYNHNQIVVYSSLPYKELESVDMNPKTPGVLRQQLVRYRSSNTMLHDSQGLTMSGPADMQKSNRGAKNHAIAGHVTTNRNTGKRMRSGKRGSARRNHSLEPIRESLHVQSSHKKR